MPCDHPGTMLRNFSIARYSFGGQRVCDCIYDVLFHLESIAVAIAKCSSALAACPNCHCTAVRAAWASATHWILQMHAGTEQQRSMPLQHISCRVKRWEQHGGNNMVGTTMTTARKPANILQVLLTVLRSHTYHCCRGSWHLHAPQQAHCSMICIICVRQRQHYADRCIFSCHSSNTAAVDHMLQHWPWKSACVHALIAWLYQRR